MGATSKKPMLEVTGFGISFSGLKALDNVNLYVEEGSICSLIGPNGAGKTTLFNVISGVLRADSGRINFQGRNITGLRPYRICQAGIAKTYQLRNNFPNLTPNGCAQRSRSTTGHDGRSGRRRYSNHRH